MESYTLIPVGSQKSFYGRARVLIVEGVRILVSYSTAVAAIKDGKLICTWGGWTATTAKHLRSFSPDYPGKAKFGEDKVYTLDEILSADGAREVRQFLHLL